MNARNAARTPPLIRGSDRTLRARLLNTKDILKLAVWNVRSLNEAGKAELLCDELKRFGVGLAVITECFLPGNGERTITTTCEAKSFVLYHSNEEKKRRGVGFVVDRKYEDL